MSDGKLPVLQAYECADPRRGADQRGPHLAFDPLFAATLVNQIAPAEIEIAQAYPKKRGPRAGIAIDLKA